MAREEPKNIDAEMSVLCCGILEKLSLDKILDEVTDDMFYSDANAEIFKVMKELHINNIPVDIKTICNELDKKKILSKVGGVNYITEIVNCEPSTANLGHYIKIIFEKSVLRNLISKANKIQQECYDEKEELVNIVENAERNILSVYNDKMGRDLVRIQEILPVVQEQIDMASKTDCIGVKSFFEDLDRKTRGFQKKQVIIIAGRPGCGKSAFALNIGLNAAINGKKSIALFSLEMGADEITKRMFGCVGKIDGDVIKSGKLSHTDWTHWNEAMSQLADTKFFVDDSGGMTVAEIRRKCRKLKNSPDGLDLIIIDYLQLLSSSNKYSGQRVQEVGEISRDLKKLAMELDIPVIALAQLSRSVEQRKGDKPKLSDLRESGSIEQDADIVLFLHSDEYGQYKGEKNRAIDLLIAKHRAGATGTINLNFSMNTGSFNSVINRDLENEE